MPELVFRLQKVLQEIGGTYEIIFVDDASPDNSWEIIEELSRQYPELIGIRLMRNYGQHSALAAGIRISRGEVVITMDDDLQTPPEELPKLLNKLDEGYDLVYGIRQKEAHGPLRNLCSRLGKKLLDRFFGVSVASSLSSYRAFRGCLKEQVASHRGPIIFLDALLCWGTERVGTIEVSHQKRLHGVSGYSWRKLIRHYINMITGFSQLPLKIACYLGLFTMAIGLGLLFCTVYNFYAKDLPVTGFTFVAASVAVLFGVQLFILGIMGEYLARMHQSLIGMPAYAIRDVTNRSQPNENISNAKIQK